LDILAFPNPMHLLVPSSIKSVKVEFFGQSQSFIGQIKILTGQGQSQKSHEDDFQSRR
jgi:hypothetical protein